MAVKQSTRARIRSADLPNRRGDLYVPPARIEADGMADIWRRRVASPDDLVVLDLFCGAGGLSHGFADAGFFVAAGIDADARCTQTYEANFLARGATRTLKDITEAEIRTLVHEELGIGRVHVIVGGPPCQGFTAVGRAKLRSLPDDQREVLLERNDLYREFVRFVKVLEPLCFVMENVPHLASYQDGQIAEQIRSDFNAIGYEIGTTGTLGEPLFLEAANFGVPQTRRRLFFVGFQQGVIDQIDPPRATHFTGRRTGLFLAPARTLADAIWDLPRLDPPALERRVPYHADPESESARKLRERGALRDLLYRELMREQVPAEDRDVVYDHLIRGVREDDAEAFAKMPEAGTYRDVPKDYRRYKDDDEHFEDRYYRLPWDRPCRAITAHIARDGYWYIHPDQPRTLSVREVARVQSFPDHVRFAGHRTAVFRQIGNAVPPLLARAIADQVREALRRRGTARPVPHRPPLEEQSPLPLAAEAGLPAASGADGG